jgi:hypothetical protein
MMILPFQKEWIPKLQSQLKGLTNQFWDHISNNWDKYEVVIFAGKVIGIILIASLTYSVLHNATYSLILRGNLWRLPTWVQSTIKIFVDYIPCIYAVNLVSNCFSTSDNIKSWRKGNFELIEKVLVNRFPAIIENDEQLARYRCPLLANSLTNNPVQVIMPNGLKTYFDYDILIQWFEHCNRKNIPFAHPTSNLPIKVGSKGELLATTRTDLSNPTVADIHICTSAKKKFDERIQNLAQQRLITPQMTDLLSVERKAYMEGILKSMTGSLLFSGVTPPLVEENEIQFSNN